MNRLTENKIILVTRPTRIAELSRRFSTRSQAKFWISHLGQDFSDYEHEDEHYTRAVREAEKILDGIGRVQMIDRAFLPNFVFGPQDVVVVLGQDGLVANTVKYLNGQPVVGVNPDPARWDGQLLPFRVPDLKKIMPQVIKQTRPTKTATMAMATLNTGEVMYAVNDIFIGPRSHTSARYAITFGGHTESHSSSGVIISTGVGSTGWLKSLVAGAVGIARSTAAAPKLTSVSSEFPWDANYLCFTVREPFPSKTTQAAIVFGRIAPKAPLVLVSQMPEHGVIFSDGIEADYLEFNSGAEARVEVAERRGKLVV